MTELVLKEEVYEIIGAAMEVYWQLGRGFLEPIYQEAFEIELARRRIPFEAKRELTITYKEQQLDKTYVPDLVCYDQIVVELKTLEAFIRSRTGSVAQLSQDDKDESRASH